MSARVAETEVCDSRECETAHLLVRGDEISFVSVEQARKVGVHPLDDRAMPSDIVLPSNYVLVHDTSGTLFGKCELFVVRWRKGRGSRVENVSEEDIRVAHDYFGRDARITVGSVDVPQGPWRRITSVRFIRYRRHGYAKGFEHEYDPPVFLYSNGSPTRPLAWKLALPHGCVVDSRGFVRP